MMHGHDDGTQPKWDLEERLLEYSAAIVNLTERLASTRAGNHVGGQLLRSGTSPYFNHGEAEAAESRRDFIHKLGVCLKELRESQRALRLIVRVPLLDPPSSVEPVLRETDELIRIFKSSIRTARAREVKEESCEYRVAE
jgi:four helix bundle protein